MGRALVVLTRLVSHKNYLSLHRMSAVTPIVRGQLQKYEIVRICSR